MLTCALCAICDLHLCALCSMKPSQLAIGFAKGDSDGGSLILKRSSTPVMSQFVRHSAPTDAPLTLPGITQTSTDRDAMVARSTSGPARVDGTEPDRPAAAAGEAPAIGSKTGSMGMAAEPSRLTVV